MWPEKNGASFSPTSQLDRNTGDDHTKPGGKPPGFKMGPTGRRDRLRLDPSGLFPSSEAHVDELGPEGATAVHRTARGRTAQEEMRWRHERRGNKDRFAGHLGAHAACTSSCVPFRCVRLFAHGGVFQTHPVNQPQDTQVWSCSPRRQFALESAGGEV